MTMPTTSTVVATAKVIRRVVRPCWQWVPKSEFYRIRALVVGVSHDLGRQELSDLWGT